MVKGFSRTAARRATAVVAPALMLVLAGAVPAQAAPAPAAPDASIAASAGTTWAETMRLKLGRDIHLTRLGTQLPALRVTAKTHASTLAAARTAETAAVAVVNRETATVRTTHAKHAAAATAVTAAKMALTAAKKHRPYSKSRVAKATKALTSAQATLKARATTAQRATTALKAARAAHTATVKQLTSATATYQTAAKAVRNAEIAIKAWPADRAALAAKASALSDQVVVQQRANFTTDRTTQVYGVTVNKVVAYSFQRMIDDAAKAGIKLSGGGFRTKEQQIRLRTVNGCPDVWTAPSSSCRVPTAIPGRSLHELGLAVDVSSGGSTINTRKSAAFKWMAANAGKYGFVNLPSEPWHWSINGS
ncbi:M15 family metallopeptidase [Actinoplanes sp. DH11]|uniref:M15 family metallopeptidase n=1 Tax=Actinoplanes sp. DH11 TaxID=2857011 RepID=UPI001E5995FC|nr:M15 family metallopeptidase [Actinoplanes sp. DH11]